MQPAVVGIEATVQGLAQVLRTATAQQQPQAAVCALAGVGDRGTSAAIAAGLRAAGIPFRVAVVGDVLAAAAGALAAGPGVLVWAGTGSFAVARSPQGALVRVGGRGYLLGDQGSGYDLVRRAAAAVLLALDDLGPETGLTAALTAAFGAPSPARLGAVLQRLDTGAVAAKLPIVLEVAASGDDVAQAVLDEGMAALALLANAAVRQASLDWGGLPVVFGGGVLQHVTTLRELLQQHLSRFGAGRATLADARAGTRGAALLARAFASGTKPLADWVADVAI